jgi:hypothetical protein
MATTKKKTTARKPAARNGSKKIAPYRAARGGAR